MANEQPGGSGNIGRQQQPNTKTEGFGLTKTETSGETSGMVVAEQAKAEIQARRFLALQFPRNFDDVRQKILKNCERPSFADAAIYSKPQGGKKIEGLSIRFAEGALRCMGNLGITSQAIFDDRYKRIIRQAVEDFENNLVYSLDITIDKTVERHDPSGREVVGTRTNKQGQQVYIVVATEDELMTKERAQISKAIRTNGLRHVDGDLLDEAKELCINTSANRDAKDPDASRKKLFDSFSTTLNVMPSQIVEYLGHDVATASPAELRELRGVFAVVRDGDMSWKEVLDAKVASRRVAKPGEEVDTKGVDTLKAKLAEKDKLEKEKAAAKAATTGGTPGAGEPKNEPEKKTPTKSAPAGQASIPGTKGEPPDPDNDGR